MKNQESDNVGLHRKVQEAVKLYAFKLDGSNSPWIQIQKSQFFLLSVLHIACSN